jgi:antitoxin component YwqK of YwqJK toxin-antitoxin module
MFTPLVVMLLACTGAPTDSSTDPAAGPEPSSGRADLACPEGTKETENTTGGGSERYCDKDGLMQGPYVRYFPSGEWAAKGAYDHSEPDGDWTWRHENGQDSQKGKYVKGKQVGSWTRWYANGVKEEDGDYLSGRKAGTWTSYFESGRKREFGIYHNDMKNGLWTYLHDNEEGTVHRTEMWEGGNMKEEKIVNATPPSDDKDGKAKGKKGG